MTIQIILYLEPEDVVHAPADVAQVHFLNFLPCVRSPTLRLCYLTIHDHSMSNPYLDSPILCAFQILPSLVVLVISLFRSISVLSEL